MKHRQLLAYISSASMMDKAGEKDKNGRSSQQQRARVLPPIGKMAMSEAEAIELASQKWERFNDVMRMHIDQLEEEASKNNRRGSIFSVSIIILSASVTVISAVVGVNERYIATMIGGILTALAGIEAYFQFNRRKSEAKRQQREIEALRYKLRHQWVTTVQMRISEKDRSEAAQKFLKVGQEAYNVILNNYTLKPEHYATDRD